MKRIITNPFLEGYIGMVVVAGAVVSVAALVGWASKRLFSKRRP